MLDLDRWHKAIVLARFGNSPSSTAVVFPICVLAQTGLLADAAVAGILPPLTDVGAFEPAPTRLAPSVRPKSAGSAPAKAPLLVPWRWPEDRHRPHRRKEV